MRSKLSDWLRSARRAGHVYLLLLAGSLGANRTTNANMLSLCCEFLKRAQGRWFQRFG
jgi:hypothetical protein